MIFEAQLIGFKEGMKIAIVWLVFYSYLSSIEKQGLMKPFYVGLAAALLLSMVSFFIPLGHIFKENLRNIIFMSFALFLIMSAASLLHLSGVNLLGGKGIPASLKSAPFMNGAVLMGTVFFFTPDNTGSMFFLKDLSVMKETILMSYVSALVGLLIALTIIFVIVKLYRPYWIGSFFDIPQLLLFLAMVKLFGSGIKGIAELSLVPSVQRGFMKFIHDFVHQTFVFLMVPDHPLLKTTIWNFIAFFFGPNFASIASLFILLTLPFMFIYHSMFKPVPEPEAEKGSERRKIKAHMVSEKRRKATPVLLFIVLIFSSWFYQTGETVSQLYIPKPKPVVVDRGIIAIPLKDPTMNLMDGSLHTFSLLHEGEEIRILIIKKPDNSLAVALDACEICPPDGYGQREDHVVCIYCDTPIHIASLGQAGGCNPIPVTADIDDVFVRIQLQEILNKWGFVMSGKSKEELHEP
jgi:uncharacterized membrane protein